MRQVDEICELMPKAPSQKDRELLKRAYEFSKKAHEGQKRYSGEPYFNHCVETAKNLAQFGMDAESIAAGLLHDTLEDTAVSEEDFKKEFGETILFLVQGVTKLGKLRYHGIQRHTESLRKLFLATSKDIRVLIIKLADRLHNASTLEHVPEEKRGRIALETLEVYAPLANRLGMGRLKGELEEYAFPHAYPEKYQKVQKVLKQKSKENERYSEKTYRALKKKLAEEGFPRAHASHRIKGAYSLYKKLQRKKWDIDKVYDISAIRVIVGTMEDCYRVLGIVHTLWKPLPGRIKDYIAFPKPNGYQSLHTNVFTGDGGITEIQIRTEEMHAGAEYGIASHMRYKENLIRRKGDPLPKRLSWIDQLVEWQKNTGESGEYLKNLKADFFEDRVFVFTPKHDVVDLPIGSSVIDLAYAIHSDIGDHIFGAKVNGKMSSIDTALQNGDIVEILTRKSTKPTAKWLKYAKTTLARRHIRSHVKPD